MPRILKGQIVHGTGSHGVCLNNQLIVAQSGTPCWASPCQIVYNSPYNMVSSLDPITKVIGNAFPFRDYGSDVICAGNSVIAAGLSNVSMRVRNFSGYFEMPDQLPLDVDRYAGTVAAFTRQEGRNIHIYFSNYREGQPHPILLTEAIRSARVFEHIVSWSEELPDRRIIPRAHNISNNQQIFINPIEGNVFQTFVFNWKGNTWILYSDQEGEGHLKLINGAESYLFDEECYGLDAEIQEDGELLVTWCTNIGETAGSLRTRRL